MTSGKNMTIQDLIKEGAATLSENLCDVNFRFESELLLSFVLNKERVWLLTHQNDIIDKAQKEEYFSLIERRALGEPYGYITGTKEFMSLNFDVCPGVLIPRPDTETLVCSVMEIYKNTDVKILDLCTGSGAIAVSLAKYIDKSHVTAVDISDICIKTARKNAEKNGVAKKITVLKTDVLKDFNIQETFDCIVSNPPYIESPALSTLMKDVKDFEPTLALDGGDDGLVFYRAISRFAKEHLNSGGHLYFEVGFNQAEDVKEIMEACELSDIKYIKDLSGINRVVYGKYIGK